jgi:hypothetical protein
VQYPCLSNSSAFSFEEKENFSTKIRGMGVVQEVFNKILNSKDGDYIFQAQVLADMKPKGW